MERVAKLAGQLEREGIVLKTIDAGGGLGIDYHGGSFDAAAKVTEYAAALGKALGDFKGKLLLEPGRFIVAQAGALLARVLTVKRNGKKTFVITDAAMNDLIRPALYQAHHEIVPVRRRAGELKWWMWWVRCARRGTFLLGTGSWGLWRRGTWWRCSTQGLMGWRRLRTTTAGRGRRRCWWREGRRG